MKKKVKIGGFIDRNLQMVLITILVLSFIVGLFAILNNATRVDIIPGVIKGFNSVFQYSTWQTLLFGHGLKAISSSTAFTVIYSFGVLPVIAFLLLLLTLIKAIIKTYKKAVPNIDGSILRNRLIVLSSILISIILFTIINSPVDLVMILFWMILGFTASLIEIENKREIKFTNELHDFKNVTDESIKEFKELKLI